MLDLRNKKFDHQLVTMIWKSRTVVFVGQCFRQLRRMRGILAVLLTGAMFAATGRSGTLTVQTNILGPTPKIVAYNLGHYYPDSNTRDWWHYAGVSGARLFVSPSYIEPKDELPPWGDGVTDQTSFINRKTLVRSDPLNTNYFNWGYVTNRYATAGLIGSDIVDPSLICSELGSLGIQMLICSTASVSKFTNAANWPDKWELWHFYYEQAFYLGWQFGVQRYQMYNEPNAAGITQTDFVARLELASDAIQSAIADVNALYGKSLTAQVFAPVTAGNAYNHYSDWGLPVVTNRHVNYLGQTDTNFRLIQDYDYHQYGSGGAPSAFGSGLTTLQSDLLATMSPEPRFPTTISEFNVYDGSQFNGLTTTLDTPVNYSAFGSIAVNLVENFANELYCFKFSQTVGSGYPAKNGMLFVDNTNAPYNIGGITKAGEVWRLINKGFAPGRTLLNYAADSGALGLDVLASYDPVSLRYYLLSVNNTSTNLNLTVNFSAWNIPTNNQILVEEVSENCYGAGRLWTNVGTNLSASGIQGSNTAWLFTVPSAPQQPMKNLMATDDAQANDGANKSVNYGSNTNLVVENNSTNASYRSAAFIKFQLPSFNPTNLQLAVLTLNASSARGASAVQANVYGLANNNWSQGAITWSNAPNLAQGVPPGINYTNNYVAGVGDWTGGVAAANSAQLVGQVVAGATPATKTIDVTDFVKNSGSTNVSFLLARLVHFYGDAQDGDGVSIISTEGDPANAPRLQLVFTAVPPTPLQVTNLNVTPRPRSAIINWNTTSNATAQVEYGTTLAYGSFSALNNNLTTNQAVMLTGLATNTTYYFEAVSTQGTNQAIAAGSFSTDVSCIVPALQASYSGVWTLASSAPDKYSNPYKYAAAAVGSDSAEAIFRPTIVTPGYYDVYIWYSEGPDRSTNVPVLTSFQGGYLLTTINQTLPGGNWQLLAAGEYFAAGTNGFVRMGNGTGETNKVVIADAVEWLYSPGQDLPTNGTVPSWWSRFYFGTNAVSGSTPGSNGYSLYANYVMGLAPTDPKARLNFGITRTNSGYLATFSPYEAGRAYGLQSAVGILRPAWGTVSNLSVGQDNSGQGVIAFTGPAAALQFYRLVVQMIP
jgi:hypothetical protein